MNQKSLPGNPKREKEKHQAKLAYFFLFIYSISVLIRPHEFSADTADLMIIRIFLIVSFLLTLATFRPLVFPPQLIMLTALPPVIFLSGTFNGWLGGGIEKAEMFITTSLIPFFLYATLLTTIRRQKWLMYTSIFAALLMVYNGHIQQKAYNPILQFGIGIGDSMTVGREEMRISYLGFFSDPNDLGMFLIMNIAFIFYFYHTGKITQKLFMLTVAVCIGYGIYMTGSRGTILGALGVISVYYLVKKAGAKLIIFAAIMAPIAATLLASFGGLSSSDDSARGRLDAWYAGILMLLDNPVFGVGVGNFLDRHGLVAHNSYIHVAAELGILGYSMWGGALILTVLFGYQAIKKFSDWNIDDSALLKAYKDELLINKTLFFSMMGFMITAFFLSRHFTLLFFIFLGMHVASHMRLMQIRPELKQHYNKKYVFKCVMISFTVILAVYATLKIGL